MEIYDELVFGDSKTKHEFVEESFSFSSAESESDHVAGVFVDGIEALHQSTFMLLNKRKHQIFICSNLNSHEINIISKCQFKKETEILDAKCCQIGDSVFVLVLLESATGAAGPAAPPPSNVSQSIWIMDPYTGRAWKTLFLLPRVETLSVASISNSNGVCYFSIGSGNRFYVGSIGLLSVSAAGSIKFAYSELEFANLSSLTSKRITALHIHQNPSSEHCHLFAGTDSGIVEVWKKSGESVTFLTKMSCPGPVTQISFGADISQIRTYGVLFVSHQGKQPGSPCTISVFHIDSKFTMASKDDGVAWGRETKDQLLTFRIVPEMSGFNVAVAYRNMDGSSSFDLYSSLSNSRVSQVTVSDRVLDVLPHCGSTGNVSLLTNERLARYVDMERIPNDAFFEDHYSIIPSFEKWFTRDTSTFLYNGQKTASILSMRSKLDNELLFDKLLLLCGIQKSKYPPKDPHEFEVLFNLIVSNPNQGMTLKHCLVYYFLKDANALRAEKYADFYGITRPFLLAVDGFWSMDNGYFKEAVQNLADPCVDLDDSAETCLEWPQKILTSLYANQQYALASTFIQSTNPSVWSQSSISCVLQILAKTSHLECLHFCRKFCQHNLKDSLEVLFGEWISLDKKSAALLTAPLSKEEDSILIEYCKESAQTFAHDFLLNFLIQRGRYAEAMQSYQDLFVSRGKENANRQNLMKNVAMLLPRIQRLALGLSIPSYVAPAAEETLEERQVPEVLSQTSLRDGPKSEETILKALSKNYLTQSVMQPQSVETEEANVENGGDTEMFGEVVDERTPSKPTAAPFNTSRGTPGESLLAKKSPAISPFVQQPFTVDRSTENSPYIKPPVSGRVSIGRRSLGGVELITADETPSSKRVVPSNTSESLLSRKSAPASENSSPAIGKLVAKSQTVVTEEIRTVSASSSIPKFPISSKSATPLPAVVHSSASLMKVDTPASSKASKISNLPGTPLVATAPPLVNRSPFTSKSFSISSQPVFQAVKVSAAAPSGNSFGLRQQGIQELKKNVEVEEEDAGDGMDEDVPPPPHANLSFVHPMPNVRNENPVQKEVSIPLTSPEQVKEKTSLKKNSRTSKKTTSVSLKAQKTSPRRGKTSSFSEQAEPMTDSLVSESITKKTKEIPLAESSVAIKSSRRRGANKDKYEELNNDGIVEKVDEKPKRFSTLQTSPSKADPPLFSPRKLRSTRKNDAPAPSTLKKSANAAAKEIALKTPAPIKSSRIQQVAENTIESAAPPSTRSRSLRPRK